MMPVESTGYGAPEQTDKQRAWQAHYEAKGCKRWKARTLASKKSERSPWPGGTA